MPYSPEPVVQEFINELKNLLNVEGIAVFGSRVRGNARPDSDVDLYVLVTKGSWRDTETRRDVNFELVYSSEEETNKYALDHMDDYLNMISIAQIIYDKDGKLHRMQQRAHVLIEEGKQSRDEKDIRHLQFDAEDTLRAVAAVQDRTNAELVLNILVIKLSELAFDLQDKWTPAPKQRVTQLRSLSPELGRVFDNFYKSKEFTSRLKTAQKIVDKVFKLP